MIKVRRFLLEDKPLDISSFSGLTLYSIEYQEYNDYYSFSNSEEVADEEVILNGMTGSSWSFRGFISLPMKIFDLNAETLT